MKNLTRDAIPCWTKLVWQEDPPTISILVHQNIVDELHTIPTNAPIIPIFLRDLPKGTTFSPAREGGWGFDGILKQLSLTPDGFVPFSFEIPLVKKMGDEQCPYCDGAGNDDLRDRKCPHCVEGRAWYYDLRTIWPISASITMLTTRLGRFPPDHDTSAARPQLLSFDTCASPRNCAMSGQFSAQLVDWFRRLGVQTLDEPTKAMTTVWNKMHGGSEKYCRLSAQIAYPDGWVNIHCPGDACSLNPDSGRVPKTGGYEFSSHNLDDPFQQLTLLAALAAIETEARQALGY
jgi:hypothetical protein